MFVPATAAPHLWKKTPASLGQFKNGTGQKRFKLKNGLHCKKRTIIGSMKKMLQQAPQLWKGPGFIPTLQKKLKNGTASDLFRLQLVVDDGRDCNRKGSIYGECILQ